MCVRVSPTVLFISHRLTRFHPFLFDNNIDFDAIAIRKLIIIVHLFLWKSQEYTVMWVDTLSKKKKQKKKFEMAYFIYWHWTNTLIDSLAVRLRIVHAVRYNTETDTTAIGKIVFACKIRKCITPAMHTQGMCIMMSVFPKLNRNWHYIEWEMCGCNFLKTFMGIEIFYLLYLRVNVYGHYDHKYVQTNAISIIKTKIMGWRVSCRCK